MRFCLCVRLPSALAPQHARPRGAARAGVLGGLGGVLGVLGVGRRPLPQRAQLRQRRAAPQALPLAVDRPALALRVPAVVVAVVPQLGALAQDGVAVAAAPLPTAQALQVRVSSLPHARARHKLPPKGCTRQLSLLHLSQILEAGISAAVRGAHAGAVRSAGGRGCGA